MLAAGDMTKLEPARLDQPSTTAEQRVQAGLYQQLWIKSAAALAVTSAEQLSAELLFWNVKTAFELSQVTELLVEQSLNLAQCLSPASEKRKQVESLVHYVDDTLFPSTPQKLTRILELPVSVVVKNEPCVFHRKTSKNGTSDEIYLERGTTGGGVSPIHAVMKGIIVNDGLSASGSSPDVDVSKGGRSKKKDRHAKRLGLRMDESFSVAVSKHDIALAESAQELALERHKLAKLGRYPGSIVEGLNRPDDLDAAVREKAGAEFQSLYKDLISSAWGEDEREAFRQRYQRMIDIEYPNPGVTVCFFGSAINNLGLQSSDVDVTLQIDAGRWSVEFLARYTDMRRLAKTLRRNGMTNVVPISGARVPICKFYDPVSKKHCDMNFGNVLGVHNSRLLRAYTLIDPRVRPLIILLKHWAKNRDINDAAQGGTISSYAWSLMLLNYLQMRGILPSLQAIYDSPKPKRIVVARQTVKWRPLKAKKKAQQKQQNVDAGPPTQSTSGRPPVLVFAQHQVTVDINCLLQKKRNQGVLRRTDNVELAHALEQLVLEDYEGRRVLSNTEDGDNATAHESTILLADTYFVDDLSHLALAPFVARGQALTNDDIWLGPEGIANLFFAFLRYYAWDFYFRANHVVSVRTGKILHETPVALNEWATKTGMILLVEDPFQIDRNTTGGKNLLAVVKEMRRALTVLSRQLTSGSAGPMVAELMEETLFIKRQRVHVLAMESKSLSRGLQADFPNPQNQGGPEPQNRPQSQRPKFAQRNSQGQSPDFPNPQNQGGLEPQNRPQSQRPKFAQRNSQGQNRNPASHRGKGPDRELPKSESRPYPSVKTSATRDTEPRKIAEKRENTKTASTELRKSVGKPNPADNKNTADGSSKGGRKGPRRQRKKMMGEGFGGEPVMADEK